MENFHWARGCYSLLPSTHSWTMGQGACTVHYSYSLSLSSRQEIHVPCMEIRSPRFSCALFALAHRFTQKPPSVARRVRHFLDPHDTSISMCTSRDQKSNKKKFKYLTSWRIVPLLCAHIRPRKIAGLIFATDSDASAYPASDSLQASFHNRCEEFTGSESPD